MKKIFYLLYIITTSFFMACEKEEHLVNKNNEQLPQNPKDTVQNKFIFQWDTLIDDSKNDDEFFIGNQYIGVQRWECLATPPHIYVGATFPKSSFATTFDAAYRTT